MMGGTIEAAVFDRLRWARPPVPPRTYEYDLIESVSLLMVDLRGRPYVPAVAIGGERGVSCTERGVPGGNGARKETFWVRGGRRERIDPDGERLPCIDAPELARERPRFGVVGGGSNELGRRGDPRLPSEIACEPDLSLDTLSSSSS